MKRRLLEFIACRDCGSDFRLDVTEENDGEILTGALECPSCGARFPVLRGIPRFIDGVRTEADLRRVYADSFGHQWTTYDWLRDEDEQEFFTITDLTADDLAGKTV